MVVIEKEDQDKVTAAIQRMERELFMLRSLLGDVARCSDNQGFLEAGDLIEIVGTNKEGNVEPKRAVVTEVKYRITSLRVWLEEDSGDGTESETELNLNVGPSLTALKALHGRIGDQYLVILIESHDLAFGLQ